VDLRSLPSVDALAGRLGASHPLAVAAARAAIDDERAARRAGEPVGDVEARARAWLARATQPSLRRVLNATGVLIHTNLGRAPLGAAAREAVMRVAEGYSNLELDLSDGGRGSRHDHVEGLLRELTGAEAAIAVNNGAGAVLLAAAALAGPGREIVVSRGQLVEIGGGFRIPDVVAQAGARLVEIGTTNRTRLADYERAITSTTGAVLRAHQSNFRQLGFVEDVRVEALCGLGVAVIDDVGSGALGPLHDEPDVRRSVAAGAALVVFSGDKLLGGPQAGCLVGRAEAVAAARAHPLARALRLDKLSLAALEGTLRAHRDGGDIPLLQMLAAEPAVLRARAERLAGAIGPAAEIVDAIARVGGGALPLHELPGPAVAVAGSPDDLSRRLRTGDPPVLGRIEDDRFLLDPRTLTDAEADTVAAVVSAVTAG
jgi:L-seryl-tRNA(Ser) seleniumtransferase